MLVEAAAGALGALVALAVSARSANGRPQRVWSFALLGATLVYVGFAVAAGGRGLPRELLGTAVYLPFVVAGWRGANLAVAAGWALHVVWDLALHGAATTTPGWYPGLCVGFDLVVAVWFVVRERGQHTAFRAPVT